MVRKYRFGILATHPIQYYAPWYQALAAQPELDVTVYFAHRQTAAGQANAGFGIGFEWDVPLLDGYQHEFLENIAREPNTSLFGGCNTPAIAERIRDERFDAFLVHGWGVKSYWQAMRACWRHHVPVMVRGDSHLLTPRSKLKKFIKAMTYPRFIPRFDAYLVVGQRAREYYLAYGADPGRMHFCPHFVDNDRFSAAANVLRPQRMQLRRQWGIADDALCLVFCGKFIPQKRPMDVVLAARQAQRQARTGRPIHLLFVGSGQLEGELRRVCRNFTDDATPVEVEGQPSGTSATFTGFLNQTEIIAAYVSADTVVLSSVSETWGLAINEAMACGLPAVVSDRVGCAPDLILEGQTGFSYPCGDIGTLSEVIARLANDDELVARLGANSRAHIADYSVDAATESAVQAVARLAGSRATARSSR